MFDFETYVAHLENVEEYEGEEYVNVSAIKKDIVDGKKYKKSITLAQIATTFNLDVIVASKKKSVFEVIEGGTLDTYMDAPRTRRIFASLSNMAQTTDLLDALQVANPDYVISDEADATEKPSDEADATEKPSDEADATEKPSDEADATTDPIAEMKKSLAKAKHASARKNPAKTAALVKKVSVDESINSIDKMVENLFDVPEPVASLNNSQIVYLIRLTKVSPVVANEIEVGMAKIATRHLYTFGVSSDVSAIVKKLSKTILCNGDWVFNSLTVLKMAGVPSEDEGAKLTADLKKLCGDRFATSKTGAFELGFVANQEELEKVQGWLAKTTKRFVVKCDIEMNNIIQTIQSLHTTTNRRIWADAAAREEELDAAIRKKDQQIRELVSKLALLELKNANCETN